MITSQSLRKAKRLYGSTLEGNIRTQNSSYLLPTSVWNLQQYACRRRMSAPVRKVNGGIYPGAKKNTQTRRLAGPQNHTL